MRYIWQHIRTIIDTYKGGIPLTHFLKNYFKANPKLGGRDRKVLGAIIYSWYRCEKSITNVPDFEQKVAVCLYLCINQDKYSERFIPDDWKKGNSLTINERIDFLQRQGIEIETSMLFPYPVNLSENINKHDWLLSLFSQPDLFIRIRKNKQDIIWLLNDNAIPHNFITDTCLALPNGTAIDKLLPADSYVVQDASSQKTGSYFKPGKAEQWYDCCSGAGGKSLLLKDIEPSVILTVSDRRNTILHNLKQRFRQYHHTVPDTLLVDMADTVQLYKELGSTRFDNIICDVPCSGSGTWARTPEQAYYFDTSALTPLTGLQKNIAINAAAYLKDGGRMIYITCSAFRDENEKVVDEIIKATGLAAEEMTLINGTGIKADSMFIATLRKG